MLSAINQYCPRSGKQVSDDSLTEYRGFMVGFCNPGCRDDFASAPEDHPNDTRYFDCVIKEKELKNSN